MMRWAPRDQRRIRSHPVPFLFAGGIQDRATGWVKYGARWYNPAIGRWTQQDTLDIPLDPNNANRYAYAGNDPINNIDPTGLYLTPCQSGGITLAAGFVTLGVSYAAGIGAALSGVGTPAALGIIGGLAAGTTAVLTGYNDFLRDCTA